MEAVGLSRRKMRNLKVLKTEHNSCFLLLLNFIEKGNNLFAGEKNCLLRKLVFGQKLLQAHPVEFVWDFWYGLDSCLSFVAFSQIKSKFPRLSRVSFVFALFYFFIDVQVLRRTKNSNVLFQYFLRAISEIAFIGRFFRNIFFIPQSNGLDVRLSGISPDDGLEKATKPAIRAIIFNYIFRVGIALVCCALRLPHKLYLLPFLKNAALMHNLLF